MTWILALPVEYLIGMSLWLLGGVAVVIWLLKWRQRRRRSGRKLTPVNVFLSVWLMLAFLTLVELYFALIFDSTDSFNRSNVSRVWFRRHVEPDQKNLRLGNTGVSYRDDQPFPETIPADIEHISFVGDSFTFGHGVAEVADRFSNRVRSALAEQFPSRFLVTNLSAPGTDLNWADALVRELIENDVRIDTLVYVFCPNDIEVYHEEHMQRIGELAALESDSLLIRNTYFPNLLYYRIKAAMLPASRDYYGYLADYYCGPPWEKMREQFGRFDDLCKAHRIKLHVVIFPFLQDLGSESRFEDAREAVAAFCREQSIPVLDLHETLSQHADEDLTVSRFDAHPNPRAHQLAAEAILLFLMESKSRKAERPIIENHDAGDEFSEESSR